MRSSDDLAASTSRVLTLTGFAAVAFVATSKMTFR
jgi:hypothetical protein